MAQDTDAEGGRAAKHAAGDDQIIVLRPVETTSDVIEIGGAHPRTRLVSLAATIRRRRVVRRASATALALSVVGAGAGFFVSARPVEGPPTAVPPTTGVLLTGELTAGPSSTASLDDPRTGWTNLPAPPEVRLDAATQWTGQTLLIWGGTVPAVTAMPKNDGMVFDASSSTWSQLPPSPLVARRYSGSAWTGTELLVWGGLAGESFSVGQLGDGAAYNPRERAWRMLPPAPIGPRAPLSVWTGDELIVWGTAVRPGGRPRDGAAYRASTNTWRRIADAPIEVSDAVAVWTGREMIVFGAALDQANNTPATPTAIGAAYDPATDTWRSLPSSPLSPQASTAAWNGRDLIAWDYETTAAAYDPDRDTWRPLLRPPFDPMECHPRSVQVAAFVVGEFCGRLAVLDGVRWRDISRGEMNWWLLVPAGPIVFMLGSSERGGQPFLFSYRPGQ